MLGQALPRLRTDLAPLRVQRSMFDDRKNLYKKLKKLGQGSFGAAYSAVLGGKPVIVKVSLGTPGVVSLTEAINVMKREVQILGRLQKYPYIPRLLEVGIDYFVQEDVKGVSLLTLLDKKGLQPREIIATVVSSGIIASVLHRDGIAHNDLEPRNVLLTPQGTVLIDFGLSLAEDIDGAKEFRAGREKDVTTILETLVLVLTSREVPESIRIMVATTIEKFRKVIVSGRVDNETAKEIAEDLVFALSQAAAQAVRGGSIKHGLIKVVAV